MFVLGGPRADYLAGSVPSRLDDTCRDAAVGSGLAEHLLLLDGDVQVGAHHEFHTRVLTQLHFTSLCNYFNSHSF